MRYLIKVHRKVPSILEGEPKHSTIAALTSFRRSAAHTRTSILEFMGILRPEGDGYVRPGDECDLRAEHENFATGPSSRASANPDPNNQDPEIGSNDTIPMGQLQHGANMTTAAPREPDVSSAVGHLDTSQFQSNGQYRPEFLSFLGVAGSNQLDLGYETQDTFNPFFDLQPVSFFQDLEMPDLSQFDGGVPLNLNFLNGQQENANT